MTLAAGTRLGPYEILAPLGAGGMGDVYRARDTRLDREVAIKTLPEQVAFSPEALGRFEREARAVAALSHPGILAIHDVGRQESLVYAVTEMLEGETLRRRLTSGPLPVRKTVELGVQIASGLAAAHDKAIVHRDLKPENLFLTRDGRAKILDVGLARQGPPAGAAGDTYSPTVERRTEPGTLLGTVGYMSPEQVRGQEADARSDIFSLGAVLYEMICGRKAFGRGTAAESMTAILREDPPDLTQGEPEAPAALDRIIRRCLEKLPEERFQSARDLAYALEAASASSGRADLPSSAARPGRAARGGLAAALPAAALAVAGALAGWWARTLAGAPVSGAGLPASFSQMTDLPGSEMMPALSPDGRSVAYVAPGAGGADIFLLRVGGRNPVNLTADAPEPDGAPCFSPDGQRIAFRSERGGGGIFVMGATGESARRAADSGFNPSWSPDGREIVVSTAAFPSPLARGGRGALRAVDVATGKARAIPTPGDAVQPAWSPHGHRIAYWSIHGDGRRDLWTVPAAGEQGAAGARRVTDDAAVDWSPAWSPDGLLLYFLSDRGGVMNLWRVPIDERAGRPLGDPEPVTTPSTWMDGFSIAGDGREIVYASLDRRTTLERVPIDPVREERNGLPVPILQGSRLVLWLDWSPDGRSLVFSTFGTRENLFLLRADGSGYRQLTDDSHRNRGPRWSADGRRILFYSNREGLYQAFTIRPDGGGLQRITRGDEPLLLPIWSPAGDRLLAAAGQMERAVEVPLDGGPPAPLPPMGSGARFVASDWSPDGTRVVGISYAEGDARDAPTFSGSLTLYDPRSRAYRDLGVPAPDARWMSDSRRLVYPDDKGYSILDTDSARTKRLLEIPHHAFMARFGFDVSPDDRQLAILTAAEEADLWMMSLR